ncbi:MAG: ATP-dependent zinc metalloprotease FtsH [Mycoplasma sp.]
MKFIKNKIYTLFAEQDKQDLKKTLENNVVTSPQSEVKKDLSNPANTSKKLDPKVKKRLITSLVLLTIVGGITGLILYFNLRKTEEYISRVKNIKKEGDNKFILEVEGGQYSYFVTNSTMPYSYKRSSDGSYSLFLPRANDVPFHIRLDYKWETNGSWSYKIPGLDTVQSSDRPTTGEKAKPGQEYFDFHDKVVSPGTQNWTTVPGTIDWFSTIISFTPFLLYGFFFYFIFKMAKQQGGGQEGIFSMGKSGAQLATSNVKFDDVAGIKEEKEELSEIVDYLKNPQKYAAMGARTPKGVVLYGPPGTGKTLLAKAVAGEAGVPFFQISGSQFEDMLVGVGAKRVRDLFTKARKVAPSIIFIDEIDSVASKRGKNEFGGGLADQTINQLLAEMDGFNTGTGIVVIAATNRLDVLDDAILRPGRFDRHVQINLPDIKEREAILLIHAKNKNISKKVNMYDIARRTPGFSGAQLENVLNEATLLAVRNNQITISANDLDEAIDRVIAGPAKKSRVITEEERKLIAYHEAGHAIVGLYTPGTDVVQKITIIPRGQAAGYTMQTPEGIEKRIQSKEDLLNMIRMTLGGRAAEEIIFGKEQITTGASNDLYKITNVVRAMVMQLGMSDVGMTQFISSEGYINPYQQQKLYSDKKAQEIDNKVEFIIQDEYKNAKDVITKNKKELDLIVEALLLLETILKEDIDFIHENKKLPPNAEKIKKENALKAAEEKKEDSTPEENTNK